MTILVAAKDPVFARMMALEFAEKGVETHTAADADAYLDAVPSARFAILDAAILLDEGITEPPPQSCDCVLIGYPDELARVATQTLSRYYVVARPFVMAEFLDTLFPPDEDAPRSEPRLQKRNNPSDSIALDDALHLAYYKGEKIELTPREYALLRLLLQNRGRPVSRAEAQEVVFGDTTGGTNVVDVYINYLRAKIDNHFGIRLIATVRGRGYLIP